MKLAIGCDEAAYQLKTVLKRKISEQIRDKMFFTRISPIR